MAEYIFFYFLCFLIFITFRLVIGYSISENANLSGSKYVWMSLLISPIFAIIWAILDLQKDLNNHVINNKKNKK